MFCFNDKNARLFTESQLLLNSQPEDWKQCNTNFPKKRGRLRKPVPMEPNNSCGISSSRNCGSYDFVTDSEKASPQKVSTEELVSTRKNRKRKPETVKTSSPILTSTTSSSSYSRPDFVISNKGNDVEVLEAQNVVSIQPVLNKLPQEKKPRKRKPKKFISPFLATTISGRNATMQEKQTCTGVMVNHTVPELEILDEHPQAYSKTKEAEEAVVTIPSPEFDSSSTFSNQSTSKRNLFIQEQHNVPITTTDRLHSTLPGGSNLTLNFCRGGEFNYLITDTNAATRNIKEPSTQSPSEEHQSNISLDSACNELQNFASVGEQYPKLCSKNSGYEYVPSSNPNSPQVVPTEGKTF